MTPAERLAVVERPERRFALALVTPGVALLVLTTTFPLLYLIDRKSTRLNSSH